MISILITYHDRVALRFHFDLRDHRKPFDRLRSCLENKMTSGENEVLPETSEWMCGLKFGCTT
jgi:hypothetical protein